MMTKKTFLSSLMAVLLLGLMLSCNTTSMNPKFKWTKIGTIPDPIHQPVPGLAGPVTGVTGDFLVIAGGSNFPDAAPWDGGHKTYYDEGYLYKKKDDHLVLRGDSFNLPYKVAYPANVSIPDGVVLIGGEDEEGAISKSLLVRWNKDEEELQFFPLPDLPEVLTSGAAAALGNDLYFAGGQNKNGVSNKLYHLDLKQLDKNWKMVAELPYPVTHTVLLGHQDKTDKSLYLIGGRKSNPGDTSTIYKQVYRFGLKDKKWQKMASLPEALAAHTGVNWKGKGFLVFSGDKGDTFHKTEALIAKINREKDSLKREELTVQKDDLQKHHPGFEGQVQYYDISKNKWVTVDSIPFFGQVTTTAVNWNDQIIIPGGEIRAGVRTPEIISGQPE